jgi:hypothetical protein
MTYVLPTQYCHSHSSHGAQGAWGNKKHKSPNLYFSIRWQKNHLSSSKEVRFKVFYFRILKKHHNQRSFWHFTLPDKIFFHACGNIGISRSRIPPTSAMAVPCLAWALLFLHTSQLKCCSLSSGQSNSAPPSSIGHTRLTHKRCQLVRTVVHLLVFIGYSGQESVLQRANTTRLAHCDSITHIHQQMRTFIWNHKSPIQKNTPKRFSDKLPSFALTSPSGRWYIAETWWRAHVYRSFLILHNLCVFLGAYGDYNYTFFSFYQPVTTCVCKPEAASTARAPGDERYAARNMLSLQWTVEW